MEKNNKRKRKNIDKKKKVKNTLLAEKNLKKSHLTESKNYNIKPCDKQKNEFNTLYSINKLNAPNYSVKQNGEELKETKTKRRSHSNGCKIVKNLPEDKFMGAPNYEYMTLKKDYYKDRTFPIIDIDEKKYTIPSPINPKSNYINQSHENKECWDLRNGVSGSLLPNLLGFFTEYYKNLTGEKININKKSIDTSLFNCIAQIVSYYNIKKNGLKKENVIKQIQMSKEQKLMTDWGTTHQDCACVIFDEIFGKEYEVHQISSCYCTPKIILDRIYGENQSKLYDKYENMPPITSTPDGIVISKTLKKPCFVMEIKCPSVYIPINTTVINEPFKLPKDYFSVNYGKTENIYDFPFRFQADRKAHDHVPLYYLPQIYLECICSGINQAIYCSFTPKNITFFNVSFTKKFGSELIDLIYTFCKTYVLPISENPTPQKIEKIVSEYKTPVDLYTKKQKELYDNFITKTIKNEVKEKIIAEISFNDLPNKIKSMFNY